MTREEKIEKLRNLQKAYIIYSLFTKIPFVECEEGNFYDQAFLFETKEDADAMAQLFFDSGDPVGVTELKTVEMPQTSQENNNTVPFRKLMRNQVREHLMKFPLCGINAVFFKPAGEEGESLPIDDILPNEVKELVEKEKSPRTGVQLTGIYFAQYLRRKEKDDAVMQERYEEFYANLARTKLLLPVIPPEEQKAEKAINLTQCKLPVFTPQNGPEGEKVSLMGVFTNMDELVVHSRDHVQEVRVVEVDLGELPAFLPKNVEYVVVDPLTLCITLKVVDLVRAIKMIREQ